MNAGRVSLAGVIPAAGAAMPSGNWPTSAGCSRTNASVVTAASSDNPASSHQPARQVPVVSYLVAADKCTECVGAFDAPKCVEVCPVDGCIVQDPDHAESREQLQDKYNKLHV